MATLMFFDLLNVVGINSMDLLLGSVSKYKESVKIRREFLKKVGYRFDQATSHSLNEHSKFISKSSNKDRRNSMNTRTSLSRQKERQLLANVPLYST